MRAMLLAAGLGTRLRPLTDHRPKALVEINGRTLLEIALSRLRNFGVREVIINVHHFADMVADYLKSNHDFGMNIELSREEILLDTGGGLKKAGHFFLRDSLFETTQRDEPFIVHNVDVLSAIDVNKMVEFHRQAHALATLAVQSRATSRYLLFGADLALCGRRPGDGPPELVRACPKPLAFAFSGIHVISPRLLPRLREEGVFSIITSYLRLAQEGEKILAFRADDSYWRDLGRIGDLERAGEDLRQGIAG
jgi:NDP-sugar pyrophosphorylase family protein